jgi:hypothetical protein
MRGKIEPSNGGTMPELTCRRSNDGTTMVFEFPDGAAEVLMIAMVEEDAGQPIWWLTSDAFSEMLPYTVESVESGPPSGEEKAVENALLARGVDRAALEAGRRANRKLQSFQYGGVPPGFRQVMPPGVPPPLQAGKRYCVTVMGGVGVPVGQVSFTAT